MASGNLHDLATFAVSLNDRIIIAANERKKDLAISIENNLTQATPIDTGSAISNWQVTIGAPALNIIDPYFESVLGTHSHKERGDIAGAPLNAEAAMGVARQALSVVDPGQTIFITNNDPAVWATDTGLTVMRPEQNQSPGYVDRALAVSADTISRVKLGA